MSSGEIVGLCLTIALLGGAVGVVVGVLLGRRRSDALAVSLERRRAIARWAGARRTLNRAAGSLVAAMRALGAEDRDSPIYSLREQEAQRARADWCVRCSEVDQAQAMVLALGDHLSTEKLGTGAANDARAIRTAIEGSEAELVSFHARLNEDDRAINAELLTILATLMSASSSGRIIRAMLRCVEGMADRFSRRP